MSQDNGTTPFSKARLEATSSGEEVLAEFKDPERSLIHVSDGFRRAKRNVLFWAAVTLLLSIAWDGGRSAIELTGIARNISFSQQSLVMGSVLILAFMALGYVRAEQQLFARNNPFTYGRDLQSAADLAELVRRDIRSVQIDAQVVGDALVGARKAVLEDALSLIEELRNEAKKIAQLHETVMNAGRSAKHERDQLHTIELYRPVDDASPDEWEAYGERRRTVSQTLSGWESKYRSAVAEIEKLRVNTPRLRQLISEFDAIEKKIKAVDQIELGKIDDFKAGLQSYADEIDRREKRWFYLFDRGVVWVSTGLAVFVAIWRLCYDQSLTWWLLETGL